MFYKLTPREIRIEDIKELRIADYIYMSNEVFDWFASENLVT